MGLTLRQEKFVQEFMLTDNASEAYRRAYPKSLKWKPETVNENASRLKANSKVSARIDELRTELASANAVTVESVRVELDEIKDMAMKLGNPAAAVTAVVNKAKLFGLFSEDNRQKKPQVNVGTDQPVERVQVQLPDYILAMIPVSSQSEKQQE